MHLADVPLAELETSSQTWTRGEEDVDATLPATTDISQPRCEGTTLTGEPSRSSLVAGSLMVPSHVEKLRCWFRESTWFTRCWTLQELLAPVRLVLCTTTWDQLAVIDKIDMRFICGPRNSL